MATAFNTSKNFNVKHYEPDSFVLTNEREDGQLMDKAPNPFEALVAKEDEGEDILDINPADVILALLCYLLRDFKSPAIAARVLLLAYTIRPALIDNGGLKEIADITGYTAGNLVRMLKKQSELFKYKYRASYSDETRKKMSIKAIERCGGKRQTKAERSEYQKAYYKKRKEIIKQALSKL